MTEQERQALDAEVQVPTGGEATAITVIALVALLLATLGPMLN